MADTAQMTSSMRPMRQMYGAIGGMTPTGDTAVYGGQMAATAARRGTGVPTGTPGGFAPPTSPYSGATMSTYGPGNDLRGNAILPGQSPQTARASGMADTAATNVANYNLTPFQGQAPLTSTGIAQYGALAPTQMRQAGTTNPTASYSYLDQSAGALTGGSRATGLSALSDIATDGGGGGGGFSYGGPGADVGTARAQTMQALTKAMEGTDRAKIASDTFDVTAARGDDAFNRAVRQTGQKAAALGRAGSGMVNTDLADVTTARATELDRLRKELSIDAADKSLADRMNLTNLGTSTANAFADSDRGDAGLNLAGAQLGEQSAARKASNRLSAAGQMVGAGEFDAQMYRGLGGDRFGMDSTITGERGRDADRATGIDQFNSGLAERKAGFQYGADKDTYDRSTNERDTARKDEYNTGDFLGSKFGTLAGWLDNREGRDASNRGELRGERDYQNAMSRQAMEDERTRMLDEEQLRNGRYQRGMGTAGLGYGVASPANAYGNAANNASQTAGDYFSTLGPLAQYMAMRSK